MNYYRTIRFLLRVINKKNNQWPVSSFVILGRDDQKFQTDVYEPKKYKGTILFIHGMNKHGNKDPRMQALCRAAASVGYRAVAPTFDLVARHVTDYRLINDFVDVIQFINRSKELSPIGKMAIFTASLSGFFSIRAATDISVADYITSICSIGVAFNAENSYTYVLKNNYDLYARYITVKNLLWMNAQLDAMTEKALDYAIDEAYEKDGKNRVEAFLQTLEKSTQNCLREVLEPIARGDDLLEKYIEQVKKIHDVLNEFGQIKELKCYTTLIHSDEDRVLPASETTLLYNELKQHHKPAKMLITPLLEHADFQFKYRYLIEIVKLVNAFDYFFRHMN